MKIKTIPCILLFLLSIASCHDSDKNDDGTAIYYIKDGLTQNITSDAPLLPLKVGDTFELHIETDFDTIYMNKDTHLALEWIGHHKYLGTATSVGETDFLLIAYNLRNTDAVQFELSFKVNPYSYEYFVTENQYDIETNNSEPLKQQIIEDLDATYTPAKYSSLILEHTSLKSGELAYINRVSNNTMDGTFIFLNDTLKAFYGNATHSFTIGSLNTTRELLKQDLTAEYQQKFSTNEITKVVVSSVAIAD